MRTPVLLGSGTHYLWLNTQDTDGAPITLASGAVRASVNGGDYVDAGLTLSVDHDVNGASAVTGTHRVAVDVDNATLALTDGDELDVFLSAGTVDAISVAGKHVGSFIALEDGLTTAEAADVNAQVLDVLNTDTFAEPGQGAPAATTTLVGKIGYLYKAWRNKKEQTATEQKLYNDDASTVGQKATVSDDATTATVGEMGTGA